MANYKWILTGLGVLIVVFFINQGIQSTYVTSSDRIFPENAGAIHKIELSKGEESLTLIRQDSTWAIVGHDSLEVFDHRMSTFFERVLPLKRETLMTEKKDRWVKYSIEDSTASHVRFLDQSDSPIAHAIFGQSMSDWSRNYVRVPDSPEVHLTDNSIIFLLSTKLTYWGRVPSPPEADSTAAETEISN